MTESAGSEDVAAASRAAEQARLRKERREAKIKAGGSARLNKITGLGGGLQKDPQPAPASTTDKHADPAEVDISEHYYAPQATGRVPGASPPPDNAISEAQLRQMMLGFEQQPGAAGQNPFAAAAGGPAGEDPMMKLLSQMMNNPGGGGGAGGLPPGMGSGLGGASPLFPGMGVPPQQAQLPDRYASLWRLLHFVVALGLGLYIALATPFTGSRAEREQSALDHKLGHVTQQDVARQYFFWAFATAETVLLTTRFFLDRGRARQGGGGGGGILGMAMGFLPPAVKGTVEVGMRYFQIFSSVRSDLLACIFVLGVCSWFRAV